MRRGWVWTLVLCVACEGEGEAPGAGGDGDADVGSGVEVLEDDGEASADAADEGTGAIGADADAPGDSVLAPVDPWAPGEAAFIDRTEAWGLVEAGALGVRLSAVDLDGDGWVDLVSQWQAGDTRVLRNTGEGRFEDVTAASGLTVGRAGATRPVGVYAFGDVDNDGDLDAYHGIDTASVSTEETSELYLNDGDGRFALGAESTALRMAGKPQNPASASFVDVDRDGFLDLWTPMASYSTGSGLGLLQARLWRGDGSGWFYDATEELGLTTRGWNSVADLNGGRAHPRAWAANACDLDGDGWSELLVASYGRSPNHLYQARFDGGALRYENRSVASGYAYDDDLTWQDNTYARCYCEANRGAEGCAEVPPPVVPCLKENWSHAQDREPFRLGGNSATTLCGDIDNDGDLDLFTGEIRHWWAGSGSDAGELLLNDGAGPGADVTFTRPGRAATGLEIDYAGVVPEDGVDFDRTGWNEGRMTATLIDFDNDGWQDLWVGDSDYPGAHGRLYRQDAPGHFAEVSAADGIDHNRSHGVVTADFDHDGDLDLVIGHNSLSRCRADAPNDCYATAQVRLFENVAARQRWVQVQLVGGAGANRGAVGARVVVRAAGLATQTQEVSAGHGLTGTQNDRVLHFGLAAVSAVEVEVRWPDAAGTTERWTVEADGRYRLTQGRLEAERVF